MATSVPILEPLSTGDIIDRSIGIYRRNARPLLATVTVPFLIGALGWLLMQFAQGFVEPEAEGGAPADIAMSIVLMFAGFGLSMVYAYLMVLAVAGLSRAVGDHIMLGEPITVLACLRAVRARLVDLTLGALVLAGGFTVGSMIAAAVLFVAIFAVVLVTAATTQMGLPPVVAGTVFVIVMLAALGVVCLFVVPHLMARLVFIPHAIMIEGCNAGSALTRSMTLGARAWNRVLGILAFSYFASWSLAAAVLAPVLAALWLTGHLEFDFETINAVTGGINQFSSFLVVPVWSIAFTFLYFDSRVRKEGYDVDLLVRRLPAPPGAAPGPQPFAPAVPRPKFAPDGRCLRCGRYNLAGRPTCAGCGW